ncbi:MAG: NUDIX hydrolase [Patescibacteria group bacterium]|nr:NUDIX hydrolase [Patescibacteria group bacterium]MDE1944119.1 NUDIX hydrolase [Patescibacteria group bacterium]MDE1945052.1 NUDIX hydrolase [Patescibacteria group bacterium]MDE2057512.1 NUDIX hydrolase [Patescibacteria group bacterium]
MTDAIREFGTPREDEERRDGGCAVVYDPTAKQYAVGRRGDGLLIFFSGGVEAGEDIIDGILREVREESGLHDFAHVEQIAEAMTHYRNEAKGVNRVAHATCLLAILASRGTLPTKLEAHEDFALEWASPEEIRANWAEHNGAHDLDHWLYFLERGVARLGELGYA